MTKTLRPVFRDVAADAVVSSITPSRQIAPIDVSCFSTRLFTLSVLSQRAELVGGYFRAGRRGTPRGDEFTRSGSCSPPPCDRRPRGAPYRARRRRLGRCALATPARARAVRRRP